MYKNENDEEFIRYFSHFLTTIIVLTLDTENQVRAMGGKKGLENRFNWAWEIKEDAISRATLMLSERFRTHFSNEEMLLIEKLKNELSLLPEEAIEFEYRKSLNHLSWRKIDETATNLLEALDEKININRHLLFLPDWCGR